MNKYQSVWSKDWIHPYESPWSIFEKYTLANVTTKNEVLYFLGNHEVKQVKNKAFGDKHRNLLALTGFNRTLLREVLDYDLKGHTDRLLSLLTRRVACKCTPTTSWFYNHLRWCPDCLSFGFHSMFHQFKLVNHCPFHLSKLRDRCSGCFQQLTYKFTDKGMKGPFLCQCGFSFVDYKDRWRHWGMPLSIRCEETISWLESEKSTEHLHVFNPKHAMYSSNPIKLLLQESSDPVSDGILRISVAPSQNFELDNCNDLPRTTDPHLRHFELQSSHKYHNIFEHLFNVTRNAYLDLDRHLKSGLLHEHKTCIDRLQYMLKEPERGFPPICSVAYAYVFWRQSLLGLDSFYRTVRTVPPAEYTQTFSVLGKPFIEDLQFLFERYIAHTGDFSPKKPGELSWIIYRAAFLYFSQYFRNWAEESILRAVEVTVPRGEQLAELAVRNMPFFVIQRPLTYTGSMSLHTEKSHKEPLNELVLPCPYVTRKSWRIGEKEISFSPLSVAMRRLDDKSYDQEVKLATTYVRRLLTY